MILGHDLRVPAVHDPAAVRLDRPARLRTSSRRHATCTRPAAGVPPRHPAARRCPGIVAASLLTFIPALGRLRHAGHARRGPDDDDREDRPDHLHDRARLAVRRPRSASCSWRSRSPARCSRCAACGARSSERRREPMSEPAIRWLTRVHGPDLRVPVRPDRRPDHLQLQRSRRERSSGAGFTLDWYADAVRERRPAGCARGSRSRSPRSPSSARRSSARCSASAWPGCGSAARAPSRSLLLLPMITPEIIMGISLLVFFFAAVRHRRLDRPDLARPHHVLHLVRGDHRPSPGGGPESAARGGRARPRRLRVRGVPARHAAAARAGDRGRRDARLRPVASTTSS